MELRGYQREAVGAMWSHIRDREDNPCIVLPTGAGKGVVLAQIAKDVVAWKGRLAIVAHVKELLEQTAGNIQKLAPEVSCGIYSAGLKSRDLGYPVTVAGIQSIYDKAEEVGHLDIIAIDEAHRIPPDGEGMYRTFLDAARKVNPNVRLVGLTATPYRMQSGMICQPDHLLNHVCYEIGVRKLIVDGYLSTLKSKTTQTKVNVDGVSIRGGEFVSNELQAAMMSDEDKMIMACAEIDGKTQDRKSVLVFATGIDHAKHIASYLQDITGEYIRTIFGDTPSDERARTIREFREQKIKYLVNVDVLTTGFDAPGVDCVAILRPTMSPGLFYQMVGRGFRLAPGKADCLVLDFGGNLMRHGPVDRMRPGKGGKEDASKPNPWKECPTCQEVVERTCDVCPSCGEMFPKRERQVSHAERAANQDILSGPEPVDSVFYSKHTKTTTEGRVSTTLRVTYDVGMLKVNEFICLEHTGFPRRNAEAWWRLRVGEPVPATVDEALAHINANGIKEPKKVELEPDGKYWRIIKAIDLELKKPAEIPF